MVAEDEAEAAEGPTLTSPPVLSTQRNSKPLSPDALS